VRLALRSEIGPVGAENLIRDTDQGIFEIDCANKNVGNRDQ